MPGPKPVVVKPAGARSPTFVRHKSSRAFEEEVDLTSIARQSTAIGRHAGERVDRCHGDAKTYEDEVK